MGKGAATQVRLILGPEHHKRLRLIAAEEEQSMSSIARREIVKFIESRMISRPTGDREPRRKGDRS